MTHPNHTTQDDVFKDEVSALARLTPREREISILVAEGLTNKEIAGRLFISANTVRHHLTSIFKKLEASNRFELIILCFRHKLVVPPALELDASQKFERQAKRSVEDSSHPRTKPTTQKQRSRAK